MQWEREENKMWYQDSVDTIFGTSAEEEILNEKDKKMKKGKSIEGIPDNFVAERKKGLNCFQVDSVQDLEEGMRVYHSKGYDGYFAHDTIIEHIDRDRKVVFVTSFLSKETENELTTEGKELLKDLKKVQDYILKRV